MKQSTRFDYIKQGDCLELMKELPDKSIDMVLCDLPYGKTKCKWDNVIPFDALWEQYKRIVKDNGAIVLFSAEPFSSRLRLSNLTWYKYDLIWNKKSISGFLNAKKQPLRQHEVICVFYKRQCTYNPQMHTDRHKREWKGMAQTATECYNKTGSFERNINADDLGYPKDIIEINAVVNNSKEKVAHPTQKPVNLLRYLIRTYSNKGDVVLDNTMGSGSTCVAAIKEKRHYIGYELMNEYFNIAQKRIEEALSFVDLDFIEEPSRT